MSFSSTVKSELCRSENADPCCMIAEIAAVLRINGTLESWLQGGSTIKITTENAAFARRVFSVLKQLLNAYPEVSIKRSKKLKKHISYTITVAGYPNIIRLLGAIGVDFRSDEIPLRHAEHSMNMKKLLKKACCRKAFLRGAFFAGGSITDPEKTYHAEIACHAMDIAGELVRLMGVFKLHARVVKRKGSFVTYLKEGENIVDFLNIIGAHTALLSLENVRILKEMRNNVNRMVNCDTANLGKTVNAAVRQIDNIKYIRDKFGFENLPGNLMEIANLRLEHDDASLQELGEMLDPPLGKSGVNHRLRKLDRIAEKARGNIM